MSVENMFMRIDMTTRSRGTVENTDVEILTLDNKSNISSIDCSDIQDSKVLYDCYLNMLLMSVTEVDKTTLDFGHFVLICDLHLRDTNLLYLTIEELHIPASLFDCKIDRPLIVKQIANSIHVHKVEGYEFTNKKLSVVQLPICDSLIFDSGMFDGLNFDYPLYSVESSFKSMSGVYRNCVFECITNIKLDGLDYFRNKGNRVERVITLYLSENTRDSDTKEKLRDVLTKFTKNIDGVIDSVRTLDMTCEVTDKSLGNLEKILQKYAWAFMECKMSVDELIVYFRDSFVMGIITRDGNGVVTSKVISAAW